MRVLWAIKFVIPFAVGALLAVSAVGHLLDASKVTRAHTPLDFVPVLKTFQRQLARDQRHERVALVGDSMLMAPAAGSPSLVDRTGKVLRRLRGKSDRAKLFALWWPAWSVIGQYCIADEMIAARPDRIVLELNLRHLQDAPLGPFSYSELAGWIPWRRVPEAALLPLSRAEITLNRMLFYRLIVAAGGVSQWTALQDFQARFVSLREPVERQLEERLRMPTLAARAFARGVDGYRRVMAPGIERDSREHALDTLGDVLRGIGPEHPRLRVLDALLRSFRVAGIPTVVWVSPLNVDHLRVLQLDLHGLEASLASIRGVTRSNGAAFYDFHGSLRDRDFRDPGDHYTYVGRSSGTDLVASLLARALADPVEP